MMKKKYIFKTIDFIKTALKPEHYPVLRYDSGNIFPEIAIAGRSNVGKSTLLNHLLRCKIARISSTPGKTQALNFFAVDKKLTLVDLPGYGYAKVPPKIKATWGPMIQSYLSHSEQLKLILVLLDIRRTPNQDDLALIEWIAFHKKNMLLVLTKVDKVKLNERNTNTKKILSMLSDYEFDYVYYSATKNIGRNQLISAINNGMNHGNFE